MTMIMWFACPHQFTEIYFIVRVGLIKNENDVIFSEDLTVDFSEDSVVYECCLFSMLQLNFQKFKFSNPVQFAAFVQQLCTILKRS